MFNKNKVASELDFNKSLKGITFAYQEIAAMRMKVVRQATLTTRSFLERIARVFYELQINYKKQIEEEEQKEKKKKKTAKKKQEKAAVVLITPNSKLYGNISYRVFSTFMEFVNKNPADTIVIVGKAGKDFFDDLQTDKKYLYFELPELSVTLDDLKAMIFNLSPFDRCSVFFAEYESLVNQSPKALDISSQELLSFIPKEKGDKDRKYIFEPNLEKLLSFFKRQVESILLKQTVHESQLAWLASRIMAMQLSTERVEKEIKSLTGQERKIKAMTFDKRQMESLAGFSLWKTRQK